MREKKHPALQHVVAYGEYVVYAGHPYVELQLTALLRSELCGCFPAHACGRRRDALLSRPIHVTKGWRQLQAPTRRDTSDGAIEFPENGATKRFIGTLDEADWTSDGQRGSERDRNAAGYL